ncbi:cytoplasmic polyadenylation element-binding protein 1-B-like [Macrosteles quadrilineatus]|uniref:cytoplasmic polyadenylation element-binding protein 1-B-like n=1 Tax=Macrosteles quadrilineatus TaxID=74068 RepID=UPI0023E2C178|nr:cytoplasmic polyadenylation element-binding protein 1-B-like [Macrosteles quadrilineatus]
MPSSLPSSSNSSNSVNSPRSTISRNIWGSQVISPTSSNSTGSTFSGVDITDLASFLNSSPPIRLGAAQIKEMADLRSMRDLNGPNTARNVSMFPPRQLYSSLSTASVPPDGPSGTASWGGELPPRRFEINPTYSCKIFVGGVPWDMTAEDLTIFFSPYGRILVEWPVKDTVTQPKGYVYIIFEDEVNVKVLLNNCVRDTSDNNLKYYYRLITRSLKHKVVQIIPWRITDSNFVMEPTRKQDPNLTVFVGGLHGALTAEGLFIIMNDLFNGVSYVGIDTDKFKYPIGSARVTFNNKYSYMQAVMAAYIEIKSNLFSKKVQVDPYLEDAICSKCDLRPGPLFCKELCCYNYFCHGCWFSHHQALFMINHRPLAKTSKYKRSMQNARYVQFSHC